MPGKMAAELCTRTRDTSWLWNEEKNLKKIEYNSETLLIIINVRVCVLAVVWPAKNVSAKRQSILFLLFTIYIEHTAGTPMYFETPVYDTILFRVDITTHPPKRCIKDVHA